MVSNLVTLWRYLLLPSEPGFKNRVTGLNGFSGQNWRDSTRVFLSFLVHEAQSKSFLRVLLVDPIGKGGRFLGLV